MKLMPIPITIMTVVYVTLSALFLYLVVSLIQALQKYLKSEPVRNEKKQMSKTLGEVIRRKRLERHMTQEFVAEALGVSTQAVSKWESGASDPSTTNLAALSDLFEQHQKKSSGKSDKKRLHVRSLYHLQNRQQIISC